MSRFDYDIGIIGGGSAGLTAAAGCARLGAKTLLIEKEGRLGGDCLHYGCVPSKTLIRTSRVYHLMKQGRRFGLPELALPPVDFPQVSQRIRSVIDTIQRHDSVERFCGLGARVEFGSPAFTDEHTVDLDGRRLSSNAWVIATGSSPLVPDVEGLAGTRFITNRDIFYLDRLPASMIILGGGPIGIEMAQAFCRLGTKVTVIQRSGQILPKEDRDMADAVMAALASEGVTFHLKTAVMSVREQQGENEVTIRVDDGVTAAIRAEAVLVATGRRPNIEGLGLEGIGVQCSDKGVAVDNRMRTTQKHIFAAGDVAGGPLFTHAAGYQAGIVISNAVFHFPRKADYTHLPWCTYTDPELANIGMNESGAKKAGIRYKVWTEEFSANDRSLAEGEERGIIKLLLDEKEKPLGVQIFGPHAGELISEWVAVMAGGVGLSKLASAIHPYPTLGEISKRVSGNVLAEKLFSGTVRKGLSFFFNLRGRACGQ